MHSGETLHRVIYISSASGDASHIELDRILTTARINNSTLGVTGLLLVHDGAFFQVLEGPPEMVDLIFASIKKDRRHAGLIVLESARVTERAFPHWAMGYVDSHRLQPSQRAALIDLRGRMLGEVDGPLSASAKVNLHVDAFLRSFREFAA